MLNRIFALIGFFAFFAWGLAAALSEKVDIKPGFMASVKLDSAYLRIVIGILCFAACAFFLYLAFRLEKATKATADYFSFKCSPRLCVPTFAIWRARYFSAKPKRQNIQSKLSKVCI